MDAAYNAYTRYKSGTKTFTTWLVDAAGRAGHQSAPRWQRRSKTNKRAKRLVSTREFEALALYIVNSSTPRIVVPCSIWTILLNVIALRKECNLWISQLPQSNTRDDATRSHQNFIGVLKTVRNMLEALVVLPQPAPEAECQPTIANKFSVLQIEEPTCLSHSSCPEAPAESETISSPAADPSVQHDVERMEDDMLFACIGFLQDFSRTRSMIKNLWQDYKDGRSSLMSTALVTNSALERIAQSVDELLRDLEVFPSAPKDTDLIAWLHIRLAPDSGKIRHNLELLEAAQQDLAAKNLFDFCHIDVDVELSSHLKMTRNASSGRLRWPGDYASLLLEDCPECPMCLFKNDKHFLGLMFDTLCNTVQLEIPLPIAIDDITRAFQTASKTRMKPTSLVLLARIMLDIKRVLGSDIERGYSDLCKELEHVKQKVRDYFDIRRRTEFRNEPFHEKYDEKALSLVQEHAGWLGHDHYNCCIEQYYDRGPEPTIVDMPPFWLLKHHPLLCGLMQYGMARELKTIGTMLATSYTSVHGAAHVYNALRASRLLASDWPDMEYVINIHKTQQLFHGGLPSAPTEYLRRFMMSSGYNVANFANNKRGQKHTRSKTLASKRDLILHSDIDAIMYDRYCAEGPRTQTTNANITALFSSTPFSAEDRKIIDPLAARWRSTQSLTTTGLLLLLKAALQIEEPKLRFDQIGMHGRCYKMFQSLREDMLARAAKVRSDNDVEETMPMEGYSVMPTVLNLLASDYESAEGAQNMVTGAKKLSRKLTQLGVSLAHAAGHVQKTIREEGDVAVRELEAWGHAVQGLKRGPRGGNLHSVRCSVRDYMIGAGHLYDKLAF